MVDVGEEVDVLPLDADEPVQFLAPGVLALAVGLSLYAMRDSVTFFFSPSHPPARKRRMRRTNAIRWSPRSSGT